MNNQRVDLRDVLYAEVRLPAEARIVVERQLRTAIESGQLPPGTRIRQQVVADIFNVSRMPVREALRMLDVQGYLVNEPHKGYVVADPLERLPAKDLPEALAQVKMLYRQLTSDAQRETFECDVLRILRAAD